MSYTTDLELRVSQTPTANGAFHLYLADCTGRKVAALWGGNDEKLANGYLFSAAFMLYEAAVDTIEALKLLRQGLTNDAKAVEVIDAHLEELEYAVEHAREQKQ